MSNGFLPISKADMEEQGIEQLDFVYVTGDAYVDHPSFGHAIISRILQSHGYTVGIIAQPDWKDDKSISILGAPRLGFLWILWSTIIPCQKNEDKKIHLPRAVKWENVRIMPQLYTAT